MGCLNGKKLWFQEGIVYDGILIINGATHTDVFFQVESWQIPLSVPKSPWYNSLVFYPLPNHPKKDQKGILHKTKNKTPTMITKKQTVAMRGNHSNPLFFFISEGWGGIQDGTHQVVLHDFVQEKQDTWGGQTSSCVYYILIIILYLPWWSTRMHYPQWVQL